MKGRMFFVNSETIEDVMKTNTVSVKTPQPHKKKKNSNGEKKKNPMQWVQTIADISADLLQTEIGDLVFLCETKKKVDGKKSCDIHGVYRIMSEPYYSCSGTNDEYPFKIAIEKAYDFENPIEEYDVLNNPYINNRLWNIIGKKISGKSRGSIPLLREEIVFLIQQLTAANNQCGYQYIPYDDKNIIKKGITPLKIKYGKLDNNSAKIDYLSDFHPNDLSYFKMGDQTIEVRYEKVLEALFNQEMRQKKHRFFDAIGIDVDKVVWYGNYLVYSIDRCEMDYFVMESDDDDIPNKAFVIEFSKNGIDFDHLEKSFKYSKWVKENIFSGSFIVKPILICAKDYAETSKKSKDKVRDFVKRKKEETGMVVDIYIYQVHRRGMRFTKLDY